MEDAHICQPHLFAEECIVGSAEDEDSNMTDGGDGEDATTGSPNKWRKVALPGHSLYAVFDGHGGTYAAEYSGLNFCRVLSRQAKFVQYARHCRDRDAASLGEENSGGGGGGSVCSISSRSQQRVSKKKKVGKNQRLMDRALAHEQRMQMRKEQSQKLRANMVHSQRMNHCSVGGLPMMPYQSPSGQSCSSSTTASSIPLMHVHHQATPLNTPNNSSGKENTTMEMQKNCREKD